MKNVYPKEVKGKENRSKRRTVTEDGTQDFKASEFTGPSPVTVTHVTSLSGGERPPSPIIAAEVKRTGPRRVLVETGTDVSGQVIEGT